MSILNIFKKAKKSETNVAETNVVEPVMQSRLFIHGTNNTMLEFWHTMEKEHEHEPAYYWEEFLDWFHNQESNSFSITASDGTTTGFKRDLITHYYIDKKLSD